jgi:hypothetical protein
VSGDQIPEAAQAGARKCLCAGVTMQLEAQGSRAGQGQVPVNTDPVRAAHKVLVNGDHIATSELTSKHWRRTSGKGGLSG